MEQTKTNFCQLIKHYTKHEVLWNTTLSDFENRNKKPNAWTIIAKYFLTDKDEIENKLFFVIFIAIGDASRIFCWRG